MKLTFIVSAQLTKKSRLKMELGKFAEQTETAIAGVLPLVVTGKIKSVRVMMTDFPRELISTNFPALCGVGLNQKQKRPAVTSRRANERTTMNKEQIQSRGSSVEGRELEKVDSGELIVDSRKEGGPVINFRSDEEERADVAAALQRMRAVRKEAVQFAAVAPGELAKLIECMRQKTGQGYKLRKLLHSLWSGSATADLSDILSLDWELRKAFVAVLLGWGCSSTPTQPEFFYRALEFALFNADLMDWFREEGGAL